MLTPYEIAVRSVIPAVRRMIAHHLIADHGFTQQRAAAVLGISQSAISRYDTLERGAAINLDARPDVLNKVTVLADEIAGGNLSPSAVARKIDSICDYVISNGYMCEFHAKVEPAIKDTDCSVCLQNDSTTA